jgi:hypothetical protein
MENGKHEERITAFKSQTKKKKYEGVFGAYLSLCGTCFDVIKHAGIV